MSRLSRAFAGWLFDRLPSGSALDVSPPVRFVWFWCEAVLDPFCPAGPFAAFWFVVRHWRWLHTIR